MNGRIYDPTLDRFLQADPFIQAPKNSQSFNRYAYVWNNPLSYTDPSGYFVKWAKKRLRQNIRGLGKVFGDDVVNLVGTTLSYMYGGPAGAAAWTYQFNRAHGVSATGSLRAAATAAVMTHVAGPPSLNASSVLVASGVVDPDVARVLNFLYNGVDTNDWAATSMNAVHEVKNYYVSAEVERFANKNGMILAEFNALLTLNSFVGKAVAGSRMTFSGDGESNNISGFTTRRGGLLQEWGLSGTSAGLVGVIWDINDSILGYQGLLDAVGYEFITKGTGNLGSCHSLGTMTCNNLVARGYANSAELNSLPFGNIAVGGTMRSTYLGSGDPVNGFSLGGYLNPWSHVVDQSSKSCGFGGFACHPYDDNYVRP